MPSPTGHYEQVDGLPVVRFERTFPHPVGAVWEAVTDPAQLEKWFPTTVEISALRPGAPIEFHFAQDAYPPMTGEVREVDEPRRLVFTWGDDELTFTPERPYRCLLILGAPRRRRSARTCRQWPQQRFLAHLRARAAGFPATAEIPQ